MLYIPGVNAEYVTDVKGVDPSVALFCLRYCLEPEVKVAGRFKLKYARINLHAQMQHQKERKRKTEAKPYLMPLPRMSKKKRKTEPKP